ncbi:hypothetical protein [Palleronia abyssalis]|uniref:Uncharacterized protein n=1 Tax=Palleronia abyssalis TaxID=1501240 RepID=A0A2R8BUX0_9RHOB|nr:hypothetical protein [Palleronia abyssalis]SPJ23974.1 hypothetical protein PAA8504_01796 [Palleronia abyssalis]
MPFDVTNPFPDRRSHFGRLPRIVRLYIVNCAIGFAVAGAFTAAVLAFDVAGLGHLVTTVSGGWLAALVFFMLNGIVFAGVQTSIIVMTLDRPGGGGSGKPRRNLAPLPVEISDRSA